MTEAIEVPSVLPPRPDKIPVFLAVKDDITPAEAFALIMAITLKSRSAVPEKYSGYELCFTAQDVDKVYDMAWRHFERRPELDNVQREEIQAAPEPRIDENGKKHYSMKAGTGHYGVEGKNLKETG